METHPPLTHLLSGSPLRPPHSAPDRSQKKHRHKPSGPLQNPLPFDRKDRLCSREQVSEGPHHPPHSLGPTPTTKLLISHKDSPLTIPSQQPEDAPWGGLVCPKQQTRPQALLCRPWLTPDTFSPRREEELPACLPTPESKGQFTPSQCASAKAQICRHAGTPAHSNIHTRVHSSPLILQPPKHTPAYLHKCARASHTHKHPCVLTHMCYIWKIQTQTLGTYKTSHPGRATAL